MNDPKKYLLSTFERIISKKKLGQGYLVVGDNLDELKAFVYELVAMLIPEKFKDQIELYPYLAQLQPRSASRKIKVDEMRALEQHFQIKAEKGFLRIGIVWECDRVVEAGQNSFLKTLEEPNPNSLIILVTSRPSEVLPTTRSRCQLLALRTGGVFNLKVEEENIIKVLALLKPGVGTETALYAANVINSIFLKLNEEAASLVTPLPKRADETAADKKEREATDKAMLKSQYLSLREKYSSLIYSWFSQLVLVANGVEDKGLPYPEFFRDSRPDWLDELDPFKAEYQLECCHQFCRRLNLNVKDELLIDDFMLSVAEKRWSK